MPFVKGQSGNPGGRPKREWNWAQVLQDAVEQEINGVSVKFAVAQSLVKEALKGNVNAQRELMNRMDGMPSQKLEHEGEVVVRPILGGTTQNQLEEGEE